MISLPTLSEDFRPFLQELVAFESTQELERSSTYKKLKPRIQQVLERVWQENFAVSPLPGSNSIHAIAWNIERGKAVDDVIYFLQWQPSLQNADILLLSELDWGMARTGNRFVAREIASALGMNYAFAPCYIALTKGAGLEKHVPGRNEASLHGNALLSRFPMHRVHSLALPNGKDKMAGAEKRIGSQRAVIADIEHPSGMLRAVSLHLDAHSSQRHRRFQMRQVLTHLEQLNPRMPVLIGGDWNTTTHNSSRALYSILGYFRRVLMGVRHVVANHYPYPEQWFERQLFREIERKGYDYRNFNTPGQCTLHYYTSDLASNLNLREWVPQWCFWFIEWALKRTGGACSLKLDWFAGKGVRPVSPGVAIPGLSVEGERVSDHDPIVVVLSHYEHCCPD
jgi:endonuclease/exonuclease/phosphatase family metal-dependent hydrolase